jgi:hypothetical protein
MQIAMWFLTVALSLAAGVLVSKLATRYLRARIVALPVPEGCQGRCARCGEPWSREVTFRRASEDGPIDGVDVVIGWPRVPAREEG